MLEMRMMIGSGIYQALTCAPSSLPRVTCMVIRFLGSAWNTGLAALGWGSRGRTWSTGGAVVY